MGERTWQRQRLSTRATRMLLLGLPYGIHRLPAVFLGPRKGEVTRFVHAAMPTLDLFKRALVGMRAVIRSAQSALQKVFFEPRANFLAEALFFVSVIQVHVAP